MVEANPSSEMQRYVIYCDESCHELTPHHPFMSIGGLKVPGSFSSQEVSWRRAKAKWGWAA
jgi:hypothetical protein